MIALGLLATAAVAQSSPRVVVIVGHPGDPRVAEQHAAMTQEAIALNDRAVVLKDLTPEAARREWPALHVDPKVTFEILLIGKDGGVKLRRDRPVAASEINAVIDTMPMRRSEMQR